MPLNRIPLNSLRAFEAVARKRSFTRAAEELHVTHAAISYQVKTLEAELGLRLLRRGKRSTELTEPGRILFPILTNSLDRIAEVIHTLRASQGADILRVSLTPTFATMWLVPRLDRFRKLYPALEIRLVPSLEYVDLVQENYDTAIRCGYGDWPGLSATFLLPVDLIPVCSPTFFRSKRRPRIEDLQDCTLLHADIRHHRMGEEWDCWLRGVGAPFEVNRGLSFHDPSLAIQAAISGLGVAIGYHALVLPAIAEGKLVTPFKRKVRAQQAYFVVCPESAAETPKIANLRGWLLEEVKLPKSGPSPTGLTS